MQNGDEIPNAKLISLNTQTSNTQDWWLLGERNDPGDHIAWLESELASIEAEDGWCILIGHIMPYDF